ncbi:MAG: hypothetical protein ACRD2X_12260 [Vicinamibacteraceae bacterium]
MATLDTPAHTAAAVERLVVLPTGVRLQYVEQGHSDGSRLTSRRRISHAT